MRRLPWAIWLVTVAIGVAISPSALGDGVGPFVAYAVFVLAFATVGALVASRRPAQPDRLAVARGRPRLRRRRRLDRYAEGDATAAAGRRSPAWVGAWVWIAGLGPVATFGLLLFPDGRLPSRRWRPVAWLAGGGLVGVLGRLALAPGRFEDSRIENPVGLEAVPWLPGAAQLVGGIALFAGLVGSIASLRARYRRRRAERAPAAQVARVRGRARRPLASSSRSRSRRCSAPTS